LKARQKSVVIFAVKSINFPLRNLLLFCRKLDNKQTKTSGVSEGCYFWHCPKSQVTKGLGPTPPKAEKPGDIPKIRKLATLKQHGFFNGIPPGFSPAERFFRQRPGEGVTGVARGAGVPPYGGIISNYSFLALKIAVLGTICDFFVQSLSSPVNCKVSSFVCSINCSITKPAFAKAFT